MKAETWNKLVETRQSIAEFCERKLNAGLSIDPEDTLFLLLLDALQELQQDIDDINTFLQR